MTAPRRTGTESSTTRAFLLDITERIMREEGYAGVSSRSVAKRAGVTPALIHYYFPTLDDLFLALFRRGAERNLERHERVLSSPQPLRELWELMTEPTRSALLTEFMALANHRKSIRDEIAEYSKRSRRQQTELLASGTAQYGPGLAEIPAPALIFLMGAVSRAFVAEDALGISDGHAEVRALVERLLAQAAPVEPVAKES
ncbi:TetR/AcrR family transcriptional regulator [Frankia sp. AgB1.9]|uniref:TetR/AcrR family transcriptional regulator n=1 Tax=unclassified Frankia TaxID=2632575 RepID=UPI0019330E62|nr:MULTISPECIES: TetR/AcrR family transcriptional regulator [unclassified Frankia]MBL7488488.1 TetR/AcrR family transcriptional regulator [Frankia sp. AgW1.1]MBL7547271.1 TetR/AcrR family transcriptional regulator [Frankia sp. AgB1.9]MBL7620824.1 TetR/AcrR family transcriptional regulator [Frankia sp. AgB1.8]